MRITAKTLLFAKKILAKTFRVISKGILWPAVPITSKIAISFLSFLKG
jgi:hypothetical protein